MGVGDGCPQGIGIGVPAVPGRTHTPVRARALGSVEWRDGRPILGGNYRGAQRIPPLSGLRVNEPVERRRTGVCDDPAASWAENVQHPGARRAVYSHEHCSVDR
ncbi:hypothetical protein GCM10011583_66200 [Streptomyces camponoticapitis]|uniref:Uncharacterized protein n=1 Tax=Streptomyces camponoticapitis TaxID=1616125 RepID=A0ABQ2EX29_9ACTN|nr:hypothetical protein GCM10011583_66200 [Streptomyces camponoticapitis]